MKTEFDAEEMLRLMEESRADTRRLLFDVVKAEKDLRRQPAEGYRPILWHLGHVGAFESFWILQRVKGDASISPHYDLIFDPIKTPKDDSLNLPPIAEIEEYLGRVRKDVSDYLLSVQFDGANPLLADGYIFYMVLEHEYQHQETLMYLLQMLAPELKNCRQPSTDSAYKDQTGVAASAENPQSETQPFYQSAIKIAGGAFELGANGYPFAYDNEQPPHIVEVADFRIDKFPITNGEYATFIEEGGYQTRSLWSEAGWNWKEENRVEQPLYWSLATVEKPAATATNAAANLRWRVRELFAETALPLHHPVAGVSWHEAEAFARFVGKRLPTEAEWEKAASWNPATKSKNRFSWGDELPTADRTNFNNHHWGTTPVDAFAKGQSAYGCFDMTGNVWEWTATVFDGYKGFKAFPYAEYSELWFDADHRILKGGSWATRLPLLRASFRNFWRPRFRIAFAGFRCAAD